jgi:hypothetical protein
MDYLWVFLHSLVNHERALGSTYSALLILAMKCLCTFFGMYWPAEQDSIAGEFNAITTPFISL